MPSSLHFRRNNIYWDTKQCVDSILSEDILSATDPILYREGTDEDGGPQEIKESWERYEQSKPLTGEATETINRGTKEEPRSLKIGSSLDSTQRVRMIDFLWEYQEVFAWSYANMPGLDTSIVQHHLPINT